MQNDYELRRIVERARIEMIYTRSSLGQFVFMTDPGLPNDEEESRINSVDNLMSRLSDAISEANKLLVKIS